MSTRIITIKPKTTTDSTRAVFGDTSITYNQAGYTYNQVGQIYGGRDLVQGGRKPQISTVITKPTVLINKAI